MTRYSWKPKSETSHHDDFGKGYDDWPSKKWKNSSTRWPKWSSMDRASNSKGTWKYEDWKSDDRNSTWRCADRGKEMRDQPDSQVPEEDRSSRTRRHSQHQSWQLWSNSWRKPWSSSSSSRTTRGSGDSRGDSYTIGAGPPWTRNDSAMVIGMHREQLQAAWIEATISGLIMAGRRENGHILQEWVERSTPSSGELTCVERCLQELNIVVSKFDKTWCVKPFGSHVSGLAFKGSDLDATCLMSESTKEDPGGQSALHALEWVLRPILLRHPSFRVTQQILQARVPLLKLRFEDALDVDLSCHNVQPLRNSCLIQAYIEISPVVRNFVLAVKTWVKAADVCGAKDSKLSSYTFSIMAIYFLQVDPVANLPCLSTQAFDHAGRLPGHELPAWSCKLSLSALLVGFFRFYSQQFAWGTEVASVRLGRRLTSDADEFSLLPYRSSRRIHIEDPFDLRRNLHCVLGAKEERELQTAFKEATQLAEELDGLANWSSLERSRLSVPCASRGEGNGGEKQDLGHIADPNKEDCDGDLVNAPSSACVPSTSLAPWAKIVAKGVPSQADFPRQLPDPLSHDSFSQGASIHTKEDDWCWFFSFVGSCCAYALYAMFTGQLFRLSVATAALLTVLLVLEPRWKNSKQVGTRFDSKREPMIEGTFEAFVRSVRRRERSHNYSRSSRCRSVHAQ